ncbi:MAG TPA: 50S ribosomal protein L24 [Rickettsiales bacterium]|nr:50S ribosomal protein L24 [Rickettsiales bacterium]
MKKFKKGDQILVIAGSDKGKTGKIIAVDGDKITVEGVKLATIHKKPTSQEPGKIIKVEKPIHISNIAHIENGKAAKIKFIVEKGEGKAFTRKSRVFKKSGKKIG